jgi:hypothetical protein
MSASARARRDGSMFAPVYSPHQTRSTRGLGLSNPTGVAWCPVSLLQSIPSLGLRQSAPALSYGLRFRSRPEAASNPTSPDLPAGREMRRLSGP